MCPERVQITRKVLREKRDLRHPQDKQRKRGFYSRSDDSSSRLYAIIRTHSSPPSNHYPTTARTNAIE